MSGPPLVIYTKKIGKMIDYGTCKVSLLTNKQVDEKRTMLKTIIKLGIEQYKSNLKVSDPAAPQLTYIASLLQPKELLVYALNALIPDDKILELVEAQQESNSSVLLSKLCQNPDCKDISPKNYNEIASPLLSKTCGNDIGFQLINMQVFGQQFIQRETYGMDKVMHNDHETLLEDDN